jgi:hypothetical protein
MAEGCSSRREAVACSGSVQSAPLSDADWGFAVEGMRSDLAGTFSLEVRAGGGATLPDQAVCLDKVQPQVDGVLFRVLITPPPP